MRVYWGKGHRKTNKKANQTVAVKENKNKNHPNIHQIHLQHSFSNNPRLSQPHDYCTRFVSFTWVWTDMCTALHTLPEIWKTTHAGTPTKTKPNYKVPEGRKRMLTSLAEREVVVVLAQKWVGVGRGQIAERGGALVQWAGAGYPAAASASHKHCTALSSHAM